MPSSDIALSVCGLSKSYSIGAARETHSTLIESLVARFRSPFRGVPEKTFQALNDVSFEIKKGDVVGVVGRNGAGKSTLLKILSRITEPTQGQIDLFGRVGSLLEVGTGFHPELTGRENIFLNGAILGMAKSDIRRQFDAIVEFASVEKFLDTPVKRYSSGMYVRLAFAVAAHLNTEILIIDEVLAVGDAEFQKKCLGKMQDVANQDGRTVLFVSHNLDAVKRLCERSILLRSGALVAFGETHSVISKYSDSLPLPAQNGLIEYPKSDEGLFHIKRITLLDERGEINDDVRTWDYVRFRITFHAPRALPNGSVILQITTSSGTVVSLASTKPDQNFDVAFHAGENEVDCVFERLMLAAGNYRIGAALAVPYVEMLCSAVEQGVLVVGPADIYQSSFAPTEARYVVPMDCHWESSL